MLKLKAPAKVNLTLEVLRRRPDGYHDIRSIIQAISLHDSINMRPDSGIEVSCDEPGWVAESSLVLRAAYLLREAAGGGKGAAIDIKKRIPLMSGLGGDSSDAAAVLRGLNELWELHLPRWQLAEVAARLGSDVAFFLYGGTALAEGRGEVVTPLPALPHSWLVLLLPPVEREKGKTGRLYESLREDRFTDGQISDRLLDIIVSGGEVTPASFYNIFESVADQGFKELERYRWHFLECGAHSIRLAGSGPTFFSLFKGRAEAEKIYKKLLKKGFEAYLAETLKGVEE